jgi:hypothetical protein
MRKKTIANQTKQKQSLSHNKQQQTNKQQWNLRIATLRNEDIWRNKDTSSGPKLLFSVLIALWNDDTSQLGTLLDRPKGVLILQVSLYN